MAKEFKGTDRVDVCIFCEACCVDKSIDLKTTPGGDYVYLGVKIGKKGICEACVKELKTLVTGEKKK